MLRRWLCELKGSPWPFLYGIKLSAWGSILKLAEKSLLMVPGGDHHGLGLLLRLPKTSISANRLIDLILTVVQKDVFVSEPLS